MANFPCCVRSDCLDPANPIANFTAEGPDPNIFIGFNYGGGVNNPPNLGWDFTSTGCVGTCLSTVSQSAADLCAQSQQILCSSTQNEGGGGGGGGGGFKPPGNKPPTLFGNAATHCDILCPDGSTFRFNVSPNQFQSFSQAYADAVAQSIACIQAQSERMCLNDIVTSACVNQPYSATLQTQGGTTPIIYQVQAGTLPPGYTLAAQDIFSAVISGTCTTPGNYTFSIRATDRFGIFMVKNYTIAIIGVTNSPPSATKGSAYTFQYTAAGGTPPYTFSLIGSLPIGLSMASSGLITGTPTGTGTSGFLVVVTDSLGQGQCTVPQSLTVSGITCDATVDWANNPGTCRLRIKNFNAALFSAAGCASCTPAGVNTWDGTFPSYHPPALGSWTYQIDPTTVSLFGKVPLFGSNCACGFLNGSGYYVALACNGAPALYIWSSNFNVTGPLGTYSLAMGCSGAPASIVIEGYTP